MYSLWYETPADAWEEALPLGNGRIGAMVFSGIGTEKIALNEDSLWSGTPQDHTKKNAHKDFEMAKKFALEGKYKDAQGVIEEKLLGENSQRYLPMCDFLLETGQEGATHYRRELDLSTAVHSTTYCINNIDYKRECFVSHPGRAMVMHLTASAPVLDVAGAFACQLQHAISTQDNNLILTGVADPEAVGIRFATIANFATDGILTTTDTQIIIKNASEITICICARTNFAGPFTAPNTANLPYEAKTLSDINAINTTPYETLKAQHIADHQSLYNRVDIHFGAALDNHPTPARLAGWDKPQNDPGLFGLLFQYGRYLTIAGSREGTMPLNLQGIWNHHYYAPWNGNYTVNINLEMNYWPTEATNLPECHKPLIEFVENLRQSGQTVAREHYNAGGFTVHHNSDIWAMATPVANAEHDAGAARWAFWPLGAGWLSVHVYDHYLYNQDRQYLAQTAFPIIRDAAEFFLDVLTEDENGHLIFAPSTSPENDFIFEGGNYSVSKTATMTTAIIKETLQNAIACCNILDTQHIFKTRAKLALDRLPPYQIGTRGELLEWNEELPEAEPTHRHTSHLYPLYPAHEIAPHTPLAEACARTLTLRGDESTGWALAWRICLNARLRDAEKAMEFLQKQVRPCEGWQGGCYPNMFGSHPPFQIDSNFGAVAGMVEMLLSCPKPGEIHLLPALPKVLGTGYVTGLRAKGGITVSMWFKDGQLQKATLTLDKNLQKTQVDIILGGKTTPVELMPGEVYTI